MMIYAISVAIFLLILLIGLYLIRRQGSSSEKVVTRLCVIGFICQIIINWLFWGDGIIYNPFANGASLEKTGLVFLVLCLISIFCYSALLLILYKANEFYNE
ncbi:hypothetical protein [Moraxella marmotae]|uniref:hypothetical protein n=1 Tax=Moraxella marmotae TaxID=3344520 RepID=UPI0035D445BF